ncbi:hypothetical protein XENTR_v10018093 [Xenopus tropicalis]|nr:hypothetical protein XENTR_v10018093 [Xenopus tropicalis]
MARMEEECSDKQRWGKQFRTRGDAGPVSAKAQSSRLNPLCIYSYNFYSQLGSGSYGKVMLATLRGRKTYVAIKYIRKTKQTNYSHLVTEAQVLKIAKDCPYLCQGYAALQTQRHAFYVMEFLSGGSIKDELKQHGQLPRDRVRFHSAEIICGLRFLHGKGIIHRDLKPRNILLDHDGHVKISDFGLAKLNIFLDDTTTGWIGTLKYMAPEILQHMAYTATVDWWSLGITICQMATGNTPFKGKNRKELINSIISDQPEIPDWLDDDLKDLLGKNTFSKRISKLHPFYESIDWVGMEEEGLQPPFQPRAQSYSSRIKDSCHSSGPRRMTLHQWMERSFLAIPFYISPG